MKFVKLPDIVFGITIRKKMVKTVSLTVWDSTQDEIIQKIQQLIQKRLLEKEASFFVQGNKTYVDVRGRRKNNDFEASKSFSFGGLEPEEVKALIVEYIEANEQN